MKKGAANVQLMQKMNRLKVLDYVRRHPDTTRPSIAKGTGLSLPSVTNTTSYLLDRGILCENGTEQVDRVGRKSVFLSFCAQKYDLICVFINEKIIYIAYTDLEGKTKEKIKIDSKDLSLDEAIEKLGENVISLSKKYGKDRILGIGVAISGLVLEDSKFLLSAHLKWKSFDIKRTLEDLSGIPVFINNVSPIKAVWYFYHKCKETKNNMLFVDLENGIGAVQFFEGKISRSTLGEIGHTTVERNGEPCFCGNKGCLEAMCSLQRLFSLYEAGSAKKISSAKDIEKLYADGNNDAVYAVSECGKYLGIGLANLVNLFNPSEIVINTGDFKDCPSVVKEAEIELKNRIFPSLAQNLSITKTYETEENITYGTAFDLCNRLFDISYEKNIVE